MKKLVLIIAIIIAMKIGLMAQQEKVYVQFTFVAIDAKGNTDTVVYAMRDKATDSIDAELGEENLYGQPPKGDLDMRLIQRHFEDRDYWLFIYPGTIENFKENVDLKKDFRSAIFPINENSTSLTTGFVIKLFAKYFPIKIYLVNIISINYLPINQVNASEFIGVTFNENTNNTLHSNDLNNVFIRRSFYYVNPIDQIVVNNDTIRYYFEEPILLKSTKMHSVSFYDTTSNKYIIGVLFSLKGFGDITEEIQVPTLIPNPTKDYIQIENGNYADKYDIIDSKGNKIQSFMIEIYPYKHNVSALPKGVYFIINTTRNKSIGKFIKE